MTVAGMHIPAESKALVGLPATSFDPRHFNDPEIFDIGRGAKRTEVAHAQHGLGLVDLAPKFYPVLSSLERFWVAIFGAVAAGVAVRSHSGCAAPHPVAG